MAPILLIIHLGLCLYWLKLYLYSFFVSDAEILYNTPIHGFFWHFTQSANKSVRPMTNEHLRQTYYIQIFKDSPH